MKFIASVISANPSASRKLYVGALGLPLKRLDGEYYATEEVEGSKHFGVWPPRAGHPIALMAAELVIDRDV